MGFCEDSLSTYSVKFWNIICVFAYAYTYIGFLNYYAVSKHVKVR